MLIRLEDLAEKFDYFIIDLWGVIHDGVTPYPGVKEALIKLREKNTKILFLSNAPRRAVRVIEALGKMGITPNYYDGVVTSGEVTFEYVRTHYTTAAYYYIGPQRDAGLLDGLGLMHTENASAAAFAVVTGYDRDDSSLDEKQGDLEKCIAAKLPLLCANPDKEVVRQTGARVLCAGIIAEQYRKMGGEVIYFGKPYKAVYARCLELFGKPELSKIVAIGDSLETDIKGANDQKIPSVLVTCGIMAEKLGIMPGETPSTQALNALYTKEKIAATWALPAFRF